MAKYKANIEDLNIEPIKEANISLAIFCDGDEPLGIFISQERLDAMSDEERKKWNDLIHEFQLTFQ